jgi:sulfur carrier protein ThiS
MKVKVRLFGTLSQHFPSYQHAQGLEVEIPEGATVKELFALLGISESEGAVVIVAGRILNADDKIRDGVQVNILQSMYGG